MLREYETLALSRSLMGDVSTAMATAVAFVDAVGGAALIEREPSLAHLVDTCAKMHNELRRPMMDAARTAMVLAIGRRAVDVIDDKNDPGLAWNISGHRASTIINEYAAREDVVMMDKSGIFDIISSGRAAVIYLKTNLESVLDAIAPDAIAGLGVQFMFAFLPPNLQDDVTLSVRSCTCYTFVVQ